MGRNQLSVWKEYGLRFNGSSQYIDFGVTANLGNIKAANPTWSCWFKTNTVLEKGIARWFGSGLFILTQPNGTLLSGFYNSAPTLAYITTKNKFNDNSWHHVAVTYDGSSLIIYVDGKQENSTSTSNVIDYLNGGTFRLGSNNSAEFFDGSLKDFRIYNSALTSTQVQILYNKGPNIAFGSPVLWIKMNEGTGTTATDSSSSGYNGTITGRTTTGTTPSTMWIIDPVRPQRINKTNFNTSVLFNGTSDKIIVADNSALNFGTGDFTVECKVNIKKMGYNFLVNKYNTGSGVGWQLFTNESIVNASNRYIIWIQNNGTDYFAGISYDYIQYGKWVHIIASVTRSDVTQLKLFINGVHNPIYVGTVAYSGVSGTVTNTTEFDIGHRQSAVNIFLGGNQYDVRIYNRALTDDECLSRYYTNENITSGRVGWWKIDEGSGTTITDSQGTNNGTLTGGTWVKNTQS